MTFNCPNCHGRGYTDSEGYDECRAEGCTAHDIRVKFQRLVREHKLNIPGGETRDWLLCRLAMLMEREALGDLLLVQRRLGVPDCADTTAAILATIDTNARALATATATSARLQQALEEMQGRMTKLMTEKVAAEQRAYQLSEDLVNALRPRNSIGEQND